MGNDLRERLEALSAAVSRASFTKTSIAFLAETEIVLRGALQEAYNRGELVTRQEMEEAVAKAVAEEVADILDDLERAENDAWKPMQVFRSDEEVAVDEARHETWGKAVELVRARSEQKEGE